MKLKSWMDEERELSSTLVALRKVLIQNNRDGRGKSSAISNKFKGMKKQTIL
jgi:hypothetical protein